MRMANAEWFRVPYFLLAIRHSLLASSSALRLVAVDHPRDAELIDQHAEALGPERLLYRHADGAVVGERREDAFSFLRILGLDRHREPLRLLEPIGGRVR